MSNFSVRVVDSDGDPVKGIDVMVSYDGLLGGQETKYTNSNGWATFHNYGDDGGKLFVNGDLVGWHRLADDATYSFII